MASERTSHLTPIFSQPVWEGKTGKERERGENERVLERERVYLLSRFPSDRSVESWLDKRQSLSPLQGLRVGTGIVEFRKTPVGRGFLLLDLFFG